MFKTPKRKVLLVTMVCLAVFCVIFAAACSPTDKKVTYSVTVTTESDDLNLTTIKAQWLDGTTAVSEEVALNSDGKASVQLEAGDYTVVLLGVPYGYSFETASVTADNPNTEIKIDVASIVTYSVTVNAPEGITLPETLTARLYFGETAVGEAATVSNGAASITGYASNCTIRLKGLPEYLTYTPAAVSGTVTSITIDVTFADTDKTFTVNVVAAGAPIPDDLALQLYVGDNAVGEHIAVVGGKATVTARVGVYHVGFVNLPDYFEFEPVQVTPETTTVSIILRLATVDYTVAVISENEAILDSLTIALFNGTNAATEYKLLTNGVATFTLIAGNYSAQLKGVPDIYEYVKPQLTMSERSVTIEIKAVYYTVYLDIPANATFAPSTVKVQLTDDTGDLGEPIAFNNSGIAKFNVKPGDGYGVKITGLPDNFIYVDEDFSEEREMTVKVAEIAKGGSAYYYDSYDDWGWRLANEEDPYQIKSLGRYQLANGVLGSGLDIDTKNIVIHFTAPEEGKRLYTFSWIPGIENVYGIVYNQPEIVDGNIYHSESAGIVSFVLEKGEETSFVLKYQYYVLDENYFPDIHDGDIFYFILTLESGAAPSEGDRFMPIEIASDEMEGEHTAAEGRNEAYFKLNPNWMNDQTYIIKFNEGITVYYGSDINVINSAVANEGVITVPAWSNVYLYITATEGKQIKFTFTKYTPPAATPLEAIEIKKGEEVSFTFYSSAIAWFKFTPETSGNYRIYDIENLTEVTIYSAYKFDEDGWFGGGYYGDYEDEVGSTWSSEPIALEAGHTYYLTLGYNTDVDAVKFKIDEYAAVEGEMGNPKEAGAENTVATYVQVYFKYTVTQDGIFKFKYAGAYESTSVYFYSDAQFSVGIVNGGSMDNYNHQYLGDTAYWQPNGQDYSVHAGDVIYFTIESYYWMADSITFTIVVESA